MTGTAIVENKRPLLRLCFLKQLQPLSIFLGGRYIKECPLPDKCPLGTGQGCTFEKSAKVGAPGVDH